MFFEVRYLNCDRCAAAGGGLGLLKLFSDSNSGGRPKSTYPFDVARILPDGLDAPLEEMHGVLHLQGVEGEGVQDLPEWLGGDDVLLQDGETAFVDLRIGVLVMVKRPCVLERWCSEMADEGQPAGDFDVFVFGDGTEGSIAGEFCGWGCHGRGLRESGEPEKDLLEMDCE